MPSSCTFDGTRELCVRESVNSRIDVSSRTAKSSSTSEGEEQGLIHVSWLRQGATIGSNMLVGGKCILRPGCTWEFHLFSRAVTLACVQSFWWMFSETLVGAPLSLFWYDMGSPNEWKSCSAVCSLVCMEFSTFRKTGDMVHGGTMVGLRAQWRAQWRRNKGTSSSSDRT